MNKLFLFPIFLLVFHVSCAVKDLELKSPSEKLMVKILSGEPGLRLTLFDADKPVLNAEIGSFIFDKNVFLNANVITSVKQTSNDEIWNPVYGERSAVRDRYNELELSLKDKDDPNKTLQLICRVYDEGIAFRYKFHKKFAEHLVLNKELTAFSFDDDYDAWISDRAQSEYRKEKISKIDISCERPLVIKKSDSSFLALGEAALVDFARMKFKKDPKNPLSLQVILDGEVDLKKAGYITPWRYVMIADSPGELLENNYFIQNLNEPNELEDVSWIKPGKVIREVTLTTKGGIAC
ncbi:MAG: glycoside hydrolase family 97 N-terminal domain-containing protein, partial [Cyclobacteriaceae bacterium]|nr:glycoside hydrolase family 97 N-terminal domain-containing protein [Cyclobacteriaceae bacterium]